MDFATGTVLLKILGSLSLQEHENKLYNRKIRSKTKRVRITTKTIFSLGNIFFNVFIF
jgi:hypothetical protein